MIFPHIPIAVKKTEVLRYLGYKKNKSELPDGIDDLIDRMISKATYSMTPQGMIRQVTITSKNIETWDIVCDDGAYVIHGEKVYKHLEICQKITLLAITIGEQIDHEIDLLFQEKEPTKALILDAIGSDAAERVAEYVNEYVTKEAKRKGYMTKFRYSPGYGGWSIENQRELIDYLDAGQIQIRATEYSQLIPRKSVSAVIGWFPINQTSSTSTNTNRVACDTCELADCQYVDEQQSNN